VKTSSRIKAAIEILEISDRENTNIDNTITSYFRRRRFAGSGDRSAVKNRVYRVVRNRLKLAWWLHTGNGLKGIDQGRLLILADVAFSDNLNLEEIDTLFDGTKNSPGILSAEEKKIYESMLGQKILNVEMPKAIGLECPEWIARRLEPIHNCRFEKDLLALNQEAPFDLRVNPLHQPNREKIIKSLRKIGIETEPTPFSPIGLRSKARKRIDSTRQYRSGLIEIQDEGAQLAAILVDAKPGMQVADFCCGAGGKTLVMGGLMKNSGRILALDISRKRLDVAGKRIKRAGLHNVERKCIRDEGDPKLKRLAKKFDRVLVDVPCTGMGTWRRDPDARRKYKEADLGNIVDRQTRILNAGARLTKPGGRLIYVTCSLLPDENEGQVAKFLCKRSDYKLIPIKRVWDETILVMKGKAFWAKDEMLKLSPYEYGTDGFFIAVFLRSS